MSKTDKDVSFRYREMPVGFKWYGTRHKAGKPNLVKGYEAGPGGHSCSCCGVVDSYKGQMRKSAVQQIADGLAEYAELRRALVEDDDPLTFHNLYCEGTIEYDGMYETCYDCHYSLQVECCYECAGY